MKTGSPRLQAWLLALAAAIPRLTSAAQEEDAVCKRTSPADLRACAALQFKGEDKTLNDTYRSRMRALPTAEQGVLRDNQQQWLSERDAGCIRDLELGDVRVWGDYDHMIFIRCQTEKTRLRTDALLNADDLKQPALHPACQGSSATIDVNTCAGVAFEASDRELNATYKKIMQPLSPELRTYLRNDQRYWLERTKAFCDRQTQEDDPPMVGGSGRYQCLQDETERRTECLLNWARQPGFEPVPRVPFVEPRGAEMKP